MGQKDMGEKLLEEYNDVFADIVNTLFFQGKKLVTEEELETALPKSQYKADDNMIHEMERDISKYWTKQKVKLALVGMENQTKIEKDMPLRVIGYDGAAYRTQFLDDSQKERYPVITIVLYFGRGHWTGPRKLSEIFSVPEGLVKYFNDYKINVFEIPWLTDEQVEMFCSDFKIVADYFVQMRKKHWYKPSSQTFRHVDETLKLMSVFTGDDRFVKAAENRDKKGGLNMCEVLDRVEQKGIEKGIEKGMISTLEKLIEKGKITVQEAAEMAGMPVDLFREKCKKGAV